jgi:hypothetical protein
MWITSQLELPTQRPGKDESDADRWSGVTARLLITRTDLSRYPNVMAESVP